WPSTGNVEGQAALLVANLIHDVADLVGLAVAALHTDQISATTTLFGNRHQRRALLPGLEEHLRIVDRHLVKHLIALPREALGDRHVAGVEEAAAREPCRRREAD